MGNIAYYERNNVAKVMQRVRQQRQTARYNAAHHLCHSNYNIEQDGKKQVFSAHIVLVYPVVMAVAQIIKVLAGNFVDAVLVAAPFKLRVQEGVNHFNSLLYGGKTRRYADDVGIVMLARQRRNFFGPA